MNEPTFRRATAAVFATLCAVFVAVLLTIAGEEIHRVQNGKDVLALKEWLKSVYGHHWTGKGVLTAVTFFVVWVLAMFAVRDADGTRLARATYALVAITILGTLALFVLFGLEAFG